MGASDRDTIVAVASPPGGSDRAVLRLSGERAAAIVAAATGVEPGPRGVSARRLDDGTGTQPCMLVWMPGPRSYTREDVAELHLVGSPPLVAAALARCVELGARAAEPGEFTRRAFASGRIDLTRAEGVLGLVEAADRAAARSAAALLAGGLGGRVAALRAGLDDLRALCEASLDFDQEETGHVEVGALLDRVADLEVALDEALAWERRREPARGRPRIVLAGRPNAGKSSLFNALAAAGHERALVSDIAGSTRDGVSARWQLAGVEVELFDAPGLDVTEGLAEPDRLAQGLASETRRGADVILWCLPQPELAEDPSEVLADAPGLEASGGLLVPVVTRADRIDGPRAGLPDRLRDVPVTSAATGAGLADLAWHVAERLGLVAPSAAPDHDRAPTAEPEVAAAAALGRELSIRHRTALAGAREALAEARADLEAAALGLPLDLVAETLRGATAELDGVTGETTPEDLLDRIFAGFCLGK